jgi:hypothetical protein
MVNSPNVVNKHQNTFIREMLFHHLTRISTPRFLGKEGKVTTIFKDVFDSTKIFFLGEVDMLHHDELNSFYMICIPTLLMKRGDNSGKIDLLEDRVSHGQLMETRFHKHILS